MPGARTHRARYRARARYRSLIVARSHAVLFSLQATCGAFPWLEEKSRTKHDDDDEDDD